MKSWLTRIVMPISLAASAALTATAVPAVAAPPVPNPTQSFVLEDIFGNDCPGFNVTASLTGKFKEIVLKDGRKIQIAPATTITLSANGKTLSYVITGATHIQAPQNGVEEVVSRGRNLLIVPNVPGLHAEGLYLTIGNVNYARTVSGGEVRFFSGPGKATNVCDLLK
ncbi:hypothetical protein GA0061083_2896 [Pseudarthrobacter enclensis]|uniref:hypothetical protein n=1 Tax=Pseudarthrobacter enclensis TaxID=993070 RepID=UPI0008156D68|nr:hypothetical protein [Pseudarthrobacter enclensis]SCC14206.1 hypothetical protein GA0061083_2896 [Pseudarthrobacter enclensis]